MLITFCQLIFEDLGQISIVTLITTMILGLMHCDYTRLEKKR